jgi:hypothetical protein
MLSSFTRPLISRLAANAANRAAIAAAAVQPNAFVWDMSYYNRTPTKLFVGNRPLRKVMHHATVSPRGSGPEGACDWCLRAATKASFDVCIPRRPYHGRRAIVKYVGFEEGWASFHAGNSEYLGVEDTDLSLECIGMEVDNNNRDEPVIGFQLDLVVDFVIWSYLTHQIPLELEFHPTHALAAVPRGRKSDMVPAGYRVVDVLRLAKAKLYGTPPKPTLTPGNYRVRPNIAIGNVRSEPSTRGGTSTVVRRLAANTKVTVTKVVPDLKGVVIEGSKEWGLIGKNQYIHASVIQRDIATAASPVALLAATFQQANQYFRSAENDEGLYSCFTNH